jgi:hypothetical protein
MKKHPIGVCTALGVSITLIIGACTISQKHGPGVYIHNAYIEIYPGTQISSGDQKALNAILKHFDKSLYKIKTYEHGQLVKTQGRLDDVYIDPVLVADVIKASQQGIPNFAEQIGNPNRTHGMAPSTGHAAKMPTPLPPEESERLVRLVTPVLLKYSNDQTASAMKTGGR